MYHRIIILLLSLLFIQIICNEITFDKVWVTVLYASSTYKEFSGTEYRNNPDLYVRVTFNTPNASGIYGKDTFIGLTRVGSNRPNITFNTPMAYDWAAYGRSGPAIFSNSSLVFALWDRNLFFPDDILMKFPFHMQDIYEKNNTVVEETARIVKKKFLTKTKHESMIRFTITAWQTVV